MQIVLYQKRSSDIIMKFDPPKSPGCYLMKDKKGQIIYIGKAKNLRSRVNSYFNSRYQAPKTKTLVSKVDDIDFILTDNEVEALLLEAKLIRKHKPLFNINLKENIRYAYIKLTNEKFPRIITVRKADTPGEYFGPFTEGTSRVNIINLLNKILRIRTCKKLPKKPCLNYYIKLCDAPCIGKISEKEYKNKIDKARLVLKGRMPELLAHLKEEMQNASRSRNFELALERRDQIHALHYLEGSQKVENVRKYDQDCVAVVRSTNQALIEMFNIRRGVIQGKQEFWFENDPQILESFIQLFYHNSQPPGEIILSEDIQDKCILEKYLHKIKGKKVTITVPKAGEKRKLVELVKKNALLNLKRKNPALTELKEKLILPSLPEVIEAFDISTLQGSATVGAMVQFVSALPNKPQYRMFRVKSVDGQDDFASLKETVYRRYKRLKSESSQMPNLVVIDGGKGQLRAALDSLSALGLRIPILALAKREEEVFVPGISYPIRLKRGSEALKLLQAVRDEVHRFVIRYHRKRRDIDFRTNHNE